MAPEVGIVVRGSKRRQVPFRLVELPPLLKKLRVLRRIPLLDARNIFLAEVPLIEKALRRRRLNDFQYEHVSYFTLRSLRTACVSMAAAAETHMACLASLREAVAKRWLDRIDAPLRKIAEDSNGPAPARLDAWRDALSASIPEVPRLDE